MPRKRRVAKLVHRQLTWDDVDVSMMLDFWSGWSPPSRESDRSRSSWPGWSEYLNTWAAVRAEGLLEWEAKQAWLIASGRATVAQRAAAVATDPDRHFVDLLAWAEAGLAEYEAEGLPFAEEIYQAVLAGDTPESAVWSRQKRLAKARAGETWDGSDDNDDED